MFKVLDTNGKKIIVDKVDKTKHRHVSGREFTKDEFVIKMSKPTPTKVEIKKPISFKRK